MVDALEIFLDVLHIFAELLLRLLENGLVGAQALGQFSLHVVQLHQGFAEFLRLLVQAAQRIQSEKEQDSAFSVQAQTTQKVPQCKAFLGLALHKRTDL